MRPVGESQLSGIPSLTMTPETPKAFQHSPGKGRRLLIGIDEGTKFSSVNCGFAQYDKVSNTFDETTFEVISSAYNEHEFPSVAAIIHDDKAEPDSDITRELIFGKKAQTFASEDFYKGELGVIEFVKLARSAPSVGPNGTEVDAFANIKIAQQEVIDSFGSGCQVNVYSEFDGSKSVWTITTAKDIEAPFQMYLLDRAKLYLKHQGYQTEQINASVEDAIVGFGTTHMWPDSVLDDVRADLVGKAKFPKNTRLLSEAKAAITGRLVRRFAGHAKECISPNTQLQSDYIGKPIVGLDVGAGSADTATVLVKKADPFLKLGSPIPGRASLCGGQRLNIIAAELCFEKNKSNLEADAAANGASIQALKEALAEGFEDLKSKIQYSPPFYTLRFGCRIRASGQNSKTWRGEVKLSK
jgi:hypothetical protein